MQKNKLVAPVVKWVGGKRQLLDEIHTLLPSHITNYCEPFLGGGAVLFSMQPKKAVVNDINEDLIAVYEVIRDDVDALLLSLEQHKNTAEYYYSIRDRDRNTELYRSMTKTEKASRILYLNKTCFNGLFRVNSSGEFNSPFGYYKNPNIVNEPVLRAVSTFLQSHDIRFYHEDFSKILLQIKQGTFVYLDPPYDPVSDTSSFTGYNKGGFDRNEQKRLKECCDDLTRRNIRFMLSNSATPFILDLYQNYNIHTVSAKRIVNADATKRGTVEEVLITNYGEK